MARRRRSNSKSVRYVAVIAVLSVAFLVSTGVCVYQDYVLRNQRDAIRFLVSACGIQETR